MEVKFNRYNGTRETLPVEGECVVVVSASQSVTSFGATVRWTPRGRAQWRFFQVTDSSESTDVMRTDVEVGDLWAPVESFGPEYVD